MTQNRFQLLGLLDNILGVHKALKNDEFLWYCPFCSHHKPKLAVNLQTGAWHCWVCESKGRRLLNLFRKLNVSSDQIKELATLLQEEVPHIQSDVVQATLFLPREYRPLWVPGQDFEYQQAVQYVKARGITAGDVLRYQIGFCSTGQYEGRIIVPSFDALGKLNYFVGRSYWPNRTLGYMNPPVSKNVIGFENHINWNHPIVLCEGVFDAMATKRNAIPLFGKTVSNKLLTEIARRNIQDVYLALDNDALRQTVRVAQKSMDDGRNVYLVELNGKDPSALGFRETQKCIKRAQKLTFYDLIRLKLQLV